MIRTRTSIPVDQAMVANLILSARTGGGTFLPDGTSPTQGFAVGGKVRGLVLAPGWEARSPARAVLSWLNDSWDGRSAVGSWVDTDGSLYLDVVDIMQDGDDALLLALKRGELAIWDFDAQAEIRLDEKDSHS